MYQRKKQHKHDKNSHKKKCGASLKAGKLANVVQGGEKNSSVTKDGKTTKSHKERGNMQVSYRARKKIKRHQGRENIQVSPMPEKTFPRYTNGGETLELGKHFEESAKN